jgi:hypothetical protein
MEHRKYGGGGEPGGPAPRLCSYGAGNRLFPPKASRASGVGKGFRQNAGVDPRGCHGAGVEAAASNWNKPDAVSTDSLVIILEVRLLLLYFAFSKAIDAALSLVTSN